MNPLKILEEKIAKKKPDDFEIYWIRSRQQVVEAKEGEIDSSEEAVSQGVAVQLYQDGKVGFSSVSVVEEPFLERVVSLAYNTLALVEDKIAFSPLGPVALPPVSGIRDRSLAGRPFEEKASLARRLEREAKAFDRRIRRLRSVRYEEEEQEVTLKTSRGFEQSYARTRCEISLMAVAEENGQQEMSWEDESSPFFEKLDSGSVARRAAERAVTLLGAKPISTRKAPAVLDATVGASLLSVLAHSFFGDQVMKGKSVLKNRIGQNIYSPQVTLMDDGLLNEGYGTVPFDGEGVPVKTKAIVSQGQLNGFLQDRVSAERLGAEPTGNGVRSVYKERPRVGPTNFFIQPGNGSTQELCREMGAGFWILDLIGVHTADPVTGDFSLGASGFWIEKGKKAPVRGVAVSGNLHELLKQVVRVGSELRFYHSFGAPPMLISAIDIGGT